MDPLQALQAAYAVPSDSKQQADLLATLREHLESNPSFIPVLCSSLVRTVSGASDSLLKLWTLDLLHYGLSRANLPIEKRTEIASSSLDVLAQLLNDPSPLTVKATIQCFSSAYPLLFRYLCTNRTLRSMWDTLAASKARIIEMVWSPMAGAGLKLAALKFLQRIILVQTRGVSDPRLQKPNDPNLSFCPPDHPFIPVAALEAEGAKLVEGVVTIFYTSTNPDMMAAVVNSWSILTKQRPSQAALIINALSSWSPGSISHFPASTVRSVEKAVRILLVHLLRSPQAAPFAQLINDALALQAARMEQAVVNERNRKAAAEAEANRKRALSANNEGATNDTKRQKIDHGANAEISTVLANFDFSALPVSIITDIIVSNLQNLSEDALAAAVLKYRQNNGMIRPSVPPVAGSSNAERDVVKTMEVTEEVKAEPSDSIQMDIDEEDIEFDPEKIVVPTAGDDVQPDQQDGVEIFDVEEALKLADFKIPPPKQVSDQDRAPLVKTSMSRIWSSSASIVPVNDHNAASARGCPPQNLWMMLLVRMITRSGSRSSGGDDDQADAKMPVDLDEIRETLFNYVMTDFPGRVNLALIWMNEEWFNDRRIAETTPDAAINYDFWLQKIVVNYENIIDAKDRTLQKFLLDVPRVSDEIIDALRVICTEPDRMPVGFNTLREFVATRLPLRMQSVQILLDLTTHPEKITRGAAIITVKKWLPDLQPMADMVRAFALRLIRRLQKSPSTDPSDKHVENEEEKDVDQEDELQTEYLPEKIKLPADKNLVLQHVELLFSLSSKSPEFLDDIFDAYVHMDESVQEVIQDLITALIRSLGPNHSRLLATMKNFPQGAETLALRILTILTETARPTQSIVTLVKGIISERDLDARFLIPIIAEMDKADIVRHLPKIVSMLDGDMSAKQLVKNVFESIVTTPPQTFGSVTSNLPRVRQSELLTPAELMVLLHESEKEIGLKSAIEAIGICFSMTDVFRSEILAVVMNQIVDEPVLPVLFLRTVIQAVRTYKSLVGFVSTTLLSRLITKKIWTNAPLWEGFMRCAKVIAPASFGALLQLPKDQLRELVDKQPSLKAGLRDYVMKKAGNKARQAGFLDLFGDADGAGTGAGAGAQGEDSATATSSPSPVPQQPQAVPASTA